MTGAFVRALRAELSWTGQQFADLLGVHGSTVYRWEKAEYEEIKIEPLQAALVTLLDAELRRGDWTDRHALKTALIDGLRMGGTLRALYALLDAMYGRDGRSGKKQAPGVVVLPLYGGPEPVVAPADAAPVIEEGG